MRSHKPEQEMDGVWFVCPNCDEEYNLPEDIEAHKIPDNL